MPPHLPRLLAAGLVLALAASPAFAKGRLGFGLQVETSGFVLSPTLKQVTVSRVSPGSPAAAAGLLTGDRLLEIEGRAVPGAPAREMAGTLDDLKPGQHVHMKVRHADGSIATLDLVAGR